MTDVLDRARIALLFPKSNKKESIVYETSDNVLCEVSGCKEKAMYKLHRAGVRFCEKHYQQLLNRSLWDYVERYIIEKEPVNVLFLTFNNKEINIEVLFTEKQMRNIQYYFRDLGFRNFKLDKEVFATVVRSCGDVVYADWIEDKLIAFLQMSNDYVITQQEWEEIKKRIVQKKLLATSKKP
ncbi:hypothetical protein [Anaerocellum danielii]|uniref:Uncharacterized protein n=1 Tax=Anaerocellum danielii TaxID=1387557 RepID=A0ABZ0TXR6_9FIRM|nr:hypothetical protein [Caldicellulosiruptor danielii]WPX08215.1 hypothetical protein SOJ16_002082 [Caldicellulosiruptor danielii]